MDIEKVVDNIKHINSCLATEFADEIATAFQNFQYYGENNIIVDKQDDLEYGNQKVFSAFVNHEYSPIIRIEVEKSRGEDTSELYYNIKNAYIMS
jgi:hypothetical protein